MHTNLLVSLSQSTHFTLFKYHFNFFPYKPRDMNLANIPNIYKLNISNL